MSDDKIEQFITEKSGAVMETHPDVPDAFLAMGIDDVRALVALLRAPEARWVSPNEELPSREIRGLYSSHVDFWVEGQTLALEENAPHAGMFYGGRFHSQDDRYFEPEEVIAWRYRDNSLPPTPEV